MSGDGSFPARRPPLRRLASKRLSIGAYGKTLSTNNLFYAVQSWAGVAKEDQETMDTRSLTIEEVRELRDKRLARIKEKTRDADFSVELAAGDIQDLLRRLETNALAGLSSAQAAELLLHHGANQLDSDPPVSIWWLFLEQFNDILVVMLLGACAVSMGLSQFAAGTAIIIIVLLNAILGTIQEHGAGQALDALASLQVTITTVVRDNAPQEIDGSLIVPGDIVLIKTGDKIVADIRLIDVQDLEINEASLTGEAEPVRKNTSTRVSKQSVSGLATELGTIPESSSAEPTATATAHSPDLTPTARRSPHGSTEHALDGKDGGTTEAKTDDSVVNSSNGDLGRHERVDDKPSGGENTGAVNIDMMKKRINRDSVEEKGKKLTLQNVVYMGTEVTQGKARGVVIYTGMDTKMGQLAERLKSVEGGVSPLKQKLTKLGMFLGLISLGISSVIFVVGVSTGRGRDPSSADPLWLQMLLVAVSLTVAAVPEGLPVCVTMSLAMGMRNMTAKNALVRKLASVETLGSTTIICTDKTGTLTCGKMTVVRLWRPNVMYSVTGQGYDPEGKIIEVKKNDTKSPILSTSDMASRGRIVNPESDRALCELLTAFVLCSDATVEYETTVKVHEDGKETKVSEWVGKGNATERALVVAARKHKIERKAANVIFAEVAQNPFSSKRKMMSVLVHRAESDDNSGPFGGLFGTDRYVGIAKGAPNRILAQCSHTRDDRGVVVEMTEERRRAALSTVDGLSAQALRVLGVAYKEMGRDRPHVSDATTLESKLTFLGLAASIDPERPEVRPAIDTARRAGVTTVMITGDYLATARAIAENIGLLDKGDPANENRVMDCVKLRKLGTEIDKISRSLNKKKNKGAAPDSPPLSKDEREQLKERLGVLQRNVDDITRRVKVYARAEPFDKITIVESYKRQGHVACMTGDGVNDAAALQGANIGVAMGSGTDVAKGAADMVLLDDSFATIVAAIEEGRKIYANITKFVFFLLSTNVAEVFLILIAMLMGLQSPLSPIQILWLNLCTDGAPAVALAAERAEPGIMQEGPRPLTEPILEKIQFTGIAIQTFFECGLCLATYLVGLTWNTGSWNGQNSDKSDSELQDGVRTAQTMVIYLIVFLELARAYTSRALRTSVFTMGVFSNQWMQLAVFASVALTLLVGNTPGISDVFGMEPLNGREWGLIIGLTFICAIIDEITKVVYRATGYGERPLAISGQDSKVTETKSKGSDDIQLNQLVVR